MNGVRQKIKIDPGQRRRLPSTEKKRRDRKIDLIHQPQFDERTEQSRSAFARDIFYFVFSTQLAEHLPEIDLRRFGQMQDRVSAQLLANPARHSSSGEDEDRCEIRLKNIQ